jgi:hypothetical protein
MPEISRFLGMVITMYYDDHAPPHFHVRYGEYKAIIIIEDSAILYGYLPIRAFGLIVEWASLHREELAEDWALAARHAPLKKIQPLD